MDSYCAHKNGIACWELAIAVLRYRLLMSQGRTDEARAHAAEHGIPVKEAAHA